jgi:hypothetical protein
MARPLGIHLFVGDEFISNISFRKFYKWIADYTVRPQDGNYLMIRI